VAACTQPLTRSSCALAGCTDAPHIIHLGFAVVASLLFFLLTFAVSVSDFDPKLSSGSFLGQSQSFTELASVICKFAIIVGVLVVEDAPKFKGMIMMAASICLLYLYLKMVRGLLPLPLCL
jgi:hypothetical protein